MVMIRTIMVCSLGDERCVVVVMRSFDANRCESLAFLSRDLPTVYYVASCRLLSGVVQYLR